jgi:hypothetical protein
MYKFQSIIVLLLLVGCEPKTALTIPQKEPTCLSSQDRCVIKTGKGNFQVLFNVEQVITESEFQISVLYSGNKSVVSIKGFLEGKEMYMGKIPTFFKPSPSDIGFITTTMLGSCSREQMVWRLWLTIELIDEVNLLHTETFSIEFESSRYAT